MASSGGVSEAPSVPTVFFDSLEPGLGYANVAQANKDGIDVLVGHLADFHGYRRIAYLGDRRRSRPASSGWRATGMPWDVARCPCRPS